MAPVLVVRSVTYWAMAANRAVSSIRSTTKRCCWAAAKLAASGTPSASSTAAIKTSSSGSRRVCNGRPGLSDGRHDEPVPDPAHRLYQRGQPQLGTEGGHVDLQRAPGSFPTGAPDLADDLLSAEDDTGPLGEQGQQVELLAGERDGDPADLDLAGEQLYGDQPEADGLLRHVDRR